MYEVVSDMVHLRSVKHILQLY